MLFIIIRYQPGSVLGTRWLIKTILKHYFYHFNDYAEGSEDKIVVCILKLHSISALKSSMAEKTTNKLVPN